ncbi:hypothetical protein JZ751_013909, partial [Albula glossodonta]
CPQCRQTFSPRPVLGRNTILAEVVEKLKKTGLQAAPPAHCYAGPGDVACDVCTGRKLKAIKSCLVCLASYCETHLQPHFESPPLQKHKLVQATGNLQEKICSHHDKLLEIYCRSDQQCICYLCTMEEHKGHDTVSIAAERTEKKKELGETQRKFQQRIQEREKELQDLRQAVQSLTRSAQAAVEDRKRHKLIDASGNLQEKICSYHDKLLEVYCRTDQLCICLLCLLDKHKGHDTVSAAAERTEKQKDLGKTQRKFKQRIQEREKELQDLRQAVQSLTPVRSPVLGHFPALWGSIPLSHTVGNRLSGVPRSAQAAVEDSERIFTELIRSIERRRSEVKELIRDQEKAAVSRTEGLLERLEQEIAELRRRDAELEQLSHTEDHIHFLQSCQSVCAPPGPGDLPSITVNPHLSFEAVRKSVSELKEQLEDVCKGELLKISKSVGDFHILQLRTREDFLQYSCQLTLDPNTAYRNLHLSEGNREVTHVGQTQPYPDHPDRFDCDWQVLCREGLSGRCYWEAKWSGRGVFIAVSYK